MNIAGLDLYLFLISQHAGSWLDAYISSPAKNKQQIDLRTSGTNRKGLFAVLIFYHLLINWCLCLSHFFCIRSKFHLFLHSTNIYCAPSMCQESTVGTKNKE